MYANSLNIIKLFINTVENNDDSEN